MSDLTSGDAALQPGGSDPAGSSHAPGAWLASVRQQQGLTVEQVASQLNLAPRQVAALEADDYAALPGMVIARGFLRAYAKLLKIDPAPLLAMLAEPSPPLSTAPARQMAPSTFSQSRMPALNGGSDRSSKAPVVALLAVVVVAAGASYALGWWPDALTRRFGQLRGAVVNGSAQQASTDSSDAARAADAGGAAGGAAGSLNGAAGTGSGVLPVDAGAAKSSGGEAVLTSTTTLSNPVAGQMSADVAGRSAANPAANPAANSAVNVTTNPAPATASGTRAAPEIAAASAAAPGAASPGTTPAVAPATSSGVTQAAARGAGAAANPLVLHVQQDSWIEIKRADKTAIVSRLVKAGSVETFDIDQPVTLIVGNIAGVEASLRGAPLALDSGAKGNVAKLRIQ